MIIVVTFHHILILHTYLKLGTVTPFLEWVMLQVNILHIN